MADGDGAGEKGALGSQGGESDAARRRFDDVASLFGTIVPAAGSPVRPALRPFRPLPTTLPPAGPDPATEGGKLPIPSAPVSPLSVSPAPIAEEVMPPVPAPPDLLGRADDVAARPEPELPAPPPLVPPPPVVPPQPIVPPATIAPPPLLAAVAPRPAVAVPPPSPPPVRPRPTQIPWPDAFEPQPNYRKPEPRNWTWLLLIPTGIVVAVAFTFIDPRAIRNWVDVNLLHRTPDAGLTSLLPSSRGGSGPAMDPAGEPPIAYPAIPTNPVPVPPGTAVSPPPVDPARAAAAAARPVHVTMRFRRAAPGAEGEARRLAALLQPYGGSVELQPADSTDRDPTITYYDPADRAAAEKLAVFLANEAAHWTVRAGTGSKPPGSIDISLP